jgi:hypothetical protein
MNISTNEINQSEWLLSLTNALSIKIEGCKKGGKFVKAVISSIHQMASANDKGRKLSKTCKTLDERFMSIFHVSLFKDRTEYFSCVTTLIAQVIAMFQDVDGLNCMITGIKNDGLKQPQMGYANLPNLEISIHKAMYITEMFRFYYTGQEININQLYTASENKQNTCTDFSGVYKELNSMFRKFDYKTKTNPVNYENFKTICMLLIGLAGTPSDIQLWQLFVNEKGAVTTVRSIGESQALTVEMIRTFICDTLLCPQTISKNDLEYLITNGEYYHTDPFTGQKFAQAIKVDQQKMEALINLMPAILR